LPQREVKRKFDIYVMCISAEFHVVPKGKYMAIVSTNVETDNPEKELQPGVDLLGPVEAKFLSVSDTYEPVSDGSSDNVFISTSYDGISHFETTGTDVMNMYKRITGKDMDLTPLKQPTEGEQ